ncbi:MAG: tetratricopeptide repeat protein [Spirochaetales bacterium]|nr:tetratricopeptide repeat protein [Spirochaetales bacterium]
MSQIILQYPLPAVLFALGLLLVLFALVYAGRTRSGRPGVPDVASLIPPVSPPAEPADLTGEPAETGPISPQTEDVAQEVTEAVPEEVVLDVPEAFVPVDPPLAESAALGTEVLPEIEGPQIEEFNFFYDPAQHRERYEYYCKMFKERLDGVTHRDYRREYYFCPRLGEGLIVGGTPAAFFQGGDVSPDLIDLAGDVMPGLVYHLLRLDHWKGTAENQRILCAVVNYAMAYNKKDWLANLTGRVITGFLNAPEIAGLQALVWIVSGEKERGMRLLASSPELSGSLRAVVPYLRRDEAELKRLCKEESGREGLPLIYFYVSLHSDRSGLRKLLRAVLNTGDVFYQRLFVHYLTRAGHLYAGLRFLMKSVLPGEEKERMFSSLLFENGRYIRYLNRLLSAKGVLFSGDWYRLLFAAFASGHLDDLSAMEGTIEPSRRRNRPADLDTFSGKLLRSAQRFKPAPGQKRANVHLRRLFVEQKLREDLPVGLQLLEEMLDQGGEEAMVALSDALVFISPLEDALSMLGRWIGPMRDLAGYQLSLRLACGFYDFSRGDYFRSQLYLEKCLTRHPFYFHALAEIYTEEGRFSLAERIYRKAIQNYPVTGIYYYNYGIFLESRGRKEEAFQLYRKALELDEEAARPRLENLYVLQA